MLTRLRVSGFKNLVHVDLRLDPFTCVVGPNGVGKSNLFDAIRFLSALANHTLMEAATSVRDQHSGNAHVRDLFHHVGDRYADRMSFVAEMIVPRRAIDDLGQEAEASTTFLRYSLDIAYREPDDRLARGDLTIVKEELVHITKRDAPNQLPFPHSAGKWRDSVVTGRRSVPYFISTDGDGENRIIKLHQDGGSRGRPLPRPAANLPRTVLSVANAAESPTVLMARREMESWQLVQLEPSALRQPDGFVSPTRLGTDGRHLAATLYRLARNSGRHESTEGSKVADEAVPYLAVNGGNERVYSQIASRLAELIDDVRQIHVDLDEKREILTLYIRDKEGTPHPARIPAILQLLQDIAVDLQQPVGEDNPLRQVIVNTHSPVVFQQVPDESVVFVKTREAMDEAGLRFKKADFLCLSDTWRAKVSEYAPRGDLLAYLNPVLPREHGEPTRKKRVVDRKDVKQYSCGRSTNLTNHRRVLRCR